MRRVVAAGLAAASLVMLPACQNKDDKVKALRKAILATEHLPHTFLYRVQSPSFTQSVQGIVEDDFRFAAQVTDDNQPAFEESVSDDALAVRFADPMKVNSFIRSETDALAPTDFSGVSVLDALGSQHWVLDPQGAPNVTASASPDAKVGVDPVVDALTALDYVLQATNQSAGVKLFDPSSVNPTYRADEDDFPKPEKGSGVLRYDLAKPPLPPISAAGNGGGAGGQSGFAQTKNFRRMAVYVKDGRVIDVREEIDLRGKSLDDFIHYYEAALKESKAPRSAVNLFDAYVKNTPRSKMGTGLLEIFNEGLKQFGLPPLIVRNMSLELRDLGQKQTVVMPDTGVVHGTLKALTLARAPAATTATTDANTSDTSDTSGTSTSDTSGTNP